MNNPDSLLLARLGLALVDCLPQRHHGGHVALITSANAGEGKTFVARLLTKGLAQPAGGPCALVVVADSISPPGGPAANHHAASTGLPGGMLSRAGLFHPDDVRRELDALRARHALSLIDGPTLAECGALLQQVDVVALVVDSRRTSPQAVRRAMRLAGVDAARFCGAILNHAPNRDSGS